jgi:hypothetical protein
VCALIAGTAAVVLLLLVYRAEFSLARGQLLLGATSILIGVGTGIALGDRLRLEWLLFVAILALYIASWMVHA